MSNLHIYGDGVWCSCFEHPNPRSFVFSLDYAKIIIHLITCFHTRGYWTEIAEYVETRAREVGAEYK